jgi:hypothetical protein
LYSKGGICIFLAFIGVTNRCKARPTSTASKRSALQCAQLTSAPEMLHAVTTVDVEDMTGDKGRLVRGDEVIDVWERFSGW